MSEHVHKELLHLGGVFRSQREEKAISLKDVEAATSIRLSALEAIEAGHLGKLISPVYAQGFMKKYADFLGLDGDKLLKEHPYVLKIFQEFSDQNVDMLLDLESMEGRNSPEKAIRSWLNLGWAGAFVLGVACIWWLGTLLHFF
ncbi:helix-turn-helix domain-containing protein [Chlamydia muridarum str. Nigg]|nr:RodZ family helix-turn-helix domain-containing protein [Chlamydia muridarum]AHH22667.1 DNA-binding protein [Chlamydia muridarum str. Nigg3 CMUT3-5]AHH23591.1 DNA-binding protein [Chlamydia muridarum str. Nigg CM972]AID37813.1 DNA-binding protein [Chlamydia muridarum str. Nigg 2 MCR]AIT90483.1 DNA-binding protein [Chlamydia muridarum]AIT91369.1 DNA-binding protein [Chlamydia muridarum]